MQERQGDAAPRGVGDSRGVQALYSRPMPGGGYVRVELLTNEPGNVAVERLRGRVVMERRNHVPATPQDDAVVVEEVEGDDVNSVVGELFRIARDNAAIARRVLRRQARGFRAD